MKPHKVSSLTPFAPVLYGGPGAPLSVRERGSVLHRTRPKCETRKKGARRARDFAAEPPREQSSREGARADARRNAQSSSGGAKRDFASGRAGAGTYANTPQGCAECCKWCLAAAMVEHSSEDKCRCSKRNEGMRFAPFSVRERGSVLHRTRPKYETRKKGARCAPHCVWWWRCGELNPGPYDP